MSRRTLVAALAVAAMSFAAPTYAEDAREGIEVGTQHAGSVIETVVANLPDAGSEQNVGPYTVTANCTFTGVLTPNNRLEVVYGGHAEAAGPQVPQLTYVKCRVFNQDGDGDFSELANGGPVAATGEHVRAWRVSPVIVCAEAFAVFGPTPVTLLRIAESCSTIIA